MKILYVNTGITGHYIVYLNALLDSFKHDAIVMMPTYSDKLKVNQYIYKTTFLQNRNFKEMIRWLEEVKNCADNNQVDLIHFLEVDFLCRYFGVGLSVFKKYKTVATMHRIREGILYQISNFLLCRQFDIVVVHSSYLKKRIEEQGVKHVIHIEYPQFNKLVYSKAEAASFFGLNPTFPVIGCIGATRQEKGLDILLEALNYIREEEFQLLIAGKPAFFDDIFIKEHTISYSEKVFRYSKFMSEIELAKALCVSDIICLPYRKGFNGASGPLGEGVSLGKCIIGPNIGNLGNVIQKNNLGYTFEAENYKDLGRVIRFVLNNGFKMGGNYLAYKKQLEPQYFKESYKQLYMNVFKSKY